jgi:uncharacterized oligopeptide transporter (OPT) family protein
MEGDMAKRSHKAHGGYIAERPTENAGLLALTSSIAVGLLAYIGAGLIAGSLAAYLSDDFGNAYLGFFVGIPAGIAGFAWNLISFRRLSS